MNKNDWRRISLSRIEIDGTSSLKGMMKRVACIAGFTLLLIGSSCAPYLRAQPFADRRNAPICADRQLMERVAPAVVHLDIIRRTTPAIPPLSLPYFPFLRGSPIGEVSSILSFLTARSGTGILVDTGGDILTNAFFASGVREIRVRLFDGREIKARVLGSDPDTDLTLLKVDGLGPLPRIPFGDSDKVAMGQRVFVVGRTDSESVPLEGIVCARHQKEVITPESYRDFLQMDFRVDLSNSGGPLVDEGGKVVGITDALLSRYAGLKGVGFAVPWNMAAYVVHQIRCFGRVERGWMGLGVQDVLLRSRHLPHHIIHGVMVVEVQADGPAWEAGLRPGDVILRYRGKPIQESLTLKRLVSNTPVGEKAELLILRNGNPEKVLLTIGTRRGRRRGEDTLRRRLGIVVRPVEKRQGGTYLMGRGVVITRIDADSPMERAGFEVHDLIIEANGQSIHSGRDLKRILRGLGPGQRITFLAVDHRTNRTGYVQVRAR